MCGHDAQQAALVSYPSSEQRVPATYLLRTLREYADKALAALSPRLEALYARPGRPSIALEKLLRALLLQVPCVPRAEEGMRPQGPNRPLQESRMTAPPSFSAAC